MVSAIIPARNEEASIARAVESVAAQPEIGEVIVVNDQSTDRTGAILSELSARVPKLKILIAGNLPSGWTGKNRAVSIGAKAARGDWLLFTDADTCHLPGSMQHALQDAATHSAALVSYSPEQEMETFWERALIPFVFCRLAAKYSYARVNDPSQPDAAANGQYLLIRRDVYESIGGHRAVASRILEDVALAEIVKNSGHAIYFSASAGVVRTRMYRGFRSMWEGWSKNLYLLLKEDYGFDEAAMLVSLALLYVAGSLVRPFSAHRVALLWALMGIWLIAWHLRYAVDLRRNHFSLRLIPYLLVGGSLCEACWIASWWKNTRGSVTWKGRTYPAKTQ
ncbi:MAG: glycosyltransferase [Candidatus Acidiferrales bacterium]